MISNRFREANRLIHEGNLLASLNLLENEEPLDSVLDFIRKPCCKIGVVPKTTATGTIGSALASAAA